MIYFRQPAAVALGCMCVHESEYDVINVVLFGNPSPSRVTEGSEFTTSVYVCVWGGRGDKGFAMHIYTHDQCTKAYIAKWNSIGVHYDITQVDSPHAPSVLVFTSGIVNVG